MSTLDYKIPKKEVTVEVSVDYDGAEPETYVIFLSEFSRYRKGEETIFEFLNKGKAFIPLKHAATGAFIVLNTAEVRYVKESETSRVPPEVKTVKLCLQKDMELTVGHFKPLPDSQSRVLDYLNDKNNFIVFYHGGRKIFVNKTKIVKVEEN